MQDFSQDKLIASEQFDTFNIAYPIYIAGWEIRQVKNINKAYALVFFKKLSNTAIEAHMKLTCISQTGEILKDGMQEVQLINLKANEFFQICPLRVVPWKIELSIERVKCVDGTDITGQEPVLLINNFVPFQTELERTKGKALLSSAKGYPMNCENGWICCCGEVNAKQAKICNFCKATKKNVFERITRDNIYRARGEKPAGQKEHRKKESRRDIETTKKAVEILREQKLKEKKLNKFLSILFGGIVLTLILFFALYFSL